MKVYKRYEFLNLPAGTIFAKGKEWYFDQLQVKGDTLPADEDGYMGDFYSMEFAWVECRESMEGINRLYDMLEKGSSYPMNDSESRDGMFDPDDLFLVFEKDDLLILKTYIEEAIARCN
jgi:hypothetical protein